MKEWIYGKRTVDEHLRVLPENCERLLVADTAKVDRNLLNAAKEASIEVERVTREKLDRFAEGGNHQGVCLRVAGWKYAELDDLIEKTRSYVGQADKLPALFLLDSVQDPRNLGAIIRVADAVGAAGVVIPKDRAAGLTASVARSAAGALANVGVARVVNLARTLRGLDGEGFCLIGAAYPADQSLYEAPLNFPLGLVLGSEDKGLRPNVAAQCHSLAALPMQGGVTSLNVAVAAGIFAYESYRQYKEL
jgi:23S rRNA (guanosine2251-2'-O)-methyltransferase